MSLNNLRIISCLALLLPACAISQTKSFALPDHPGAMVLDLNGFKITQTSAKPGGTEIGVRAHDQYQTELLAFLFLTPNSKSQTGASCLTQDIDQVRKGGRKFTEQLNPFHTDASDHATILLTYANGDQLLYKYAGTGDQCLVIEAYSDKGTKLNISQASALLARQRFDPTYQSKPTDIALYEGIRGQSVISSGVIKPNTPTPEMLVTWNGRGGISLPASSEWKLELLTAYDNAARPAAQFRNASTKVMVSFIISENLSGSPTAEGCRKDIVTGIVKQAASILSNQIDGQISDGRDGHFATHSHLTLLAPGVHNHDLFAFAGNAKVCAEVHASTISGEPDEDERLAEALDLFSPDLTYTANATDYFSLASIFYKQSLMMGAPFFDAFLNALPPDITDPEVINHRRVATDNVVIALGMSGNISRSRAYAERAIKQDQDYPMNYYNLACADAEEGKPKDAQLHLEQAFARKANVLPGETMPDPIKDNSILKLKGNKDFWAFVQTLK